MSRRGGDGGSPVYRHVLRDTTPLVAFGLLCVIAAVFLVEAAIRADGKSLPVTAALVLGPLGAIWLVLVHPHVRWDSQEVVVTNIGRTHRVAWSRVASVRQNLSLSFELSDGRKLTAVAVSAPRDRGLVANALTRGRLGFGSVEVHRHADALRAYHETQAAPFDPSPGDGSSGTLDSRWDVIPLSIVGVLLVITAVTALTSIA